MAKKYRKKKQLALDEGWEPSTTLQRSTLERPRFVLRAKTGIDRLWEVYDLDEDPTTPVMEGPYALCENFKRDMEFLLRHGAQIATLDERDFESAKTDEGASALREEFSVVRGTVTAPVRALAPAPAPKPLDPAVVLALEKATTRYFVGMPEQGFDAFTAPVNIVVAGNGLFEVRRYQIGFVVTARSSERVRGLDDAPLQAGFRPLVPKIPFSVLTEIVAFFRDVNAKHRTEAYVQVFYDPRTGQYETHVPLQDISAGRVEHAGTFDPDGTRIHVLDCHSHHTMDGYFSSTDDKDESRFSGRLFGVIGKITQRIPKMLWRVRGADAFLPLSIGEVFDLAGEGAQTVTVTREAMLTGTNEQDGRLAFTIETPDLFEGARFPEAWLEPLITSRSDKRWKEIPGHVEEAARDWRYTRVTDESPSWAAFDAYTGQRAWEGALSRGMGFGGGPRTASRAEDRPTTKATGSFYKGSYFVVKQGTGELFQLLDNGQLAKVKLSGMSVKPVEYTN